MCSAVLRHVPNCAQLLQILPSVQLGPLFSFRYAPLLLLVSFNAPRQVFLQSECRLHPQLGALFLGPSIRSPQVQL